MNRLMMLLAAGFAALGAWASTYTVGGYTWTYFTVNTDAGQVAMIGNGSSCAATPKPTGALTLPSKMGTYPVGKIARNAFKGCTGLTDVTIPSGVTDIENQAFEGCSAMKTVSIPASVTLIGNFAFANCASLTYVAIPSGVTNLRLGAFAGCTKLEKVKLPSSLQTIEKWAFRNCTSLKDLTIPGSVTSIGTEAFRDCSSLGVAYLPLGLREKVAVSDVFSGAASGFEDRYYDSATASGYTWYFYVDAGGGAVLSGTPFGRSAAVWPEPSGDLAIPSTLGDYTVTGLGVHSFRLCGKLKTVSIPASVTSIYTWAFDGCSGLESFTVASGNAQYRAVNGLLLTKDGKKLVHGVTGEGGVVTIPEGVTNIGNSAFDSLAGLTSVTIPTSVTTIQDYAFYKCTGLRRVTIPDSVTSIGSYVFQACSVLSYASLPGAFRENTPVGLFTGCPPDLVISYRGFNPELTISANGSLEDVVLNGATRVTLPSVVTSIGDNAFSDLTALAHVIIPASVTSISAWAFDGCSGLKLFTVASDNPSFKASGGFLLTKDGKKLVQGVTGEDGTATIPAGVEVVGNSAFYGLDNLTAVTIPETVADIEKYAFGGCGRLKSFTVASGNTAFKAVNGLLLTKDGETLVCGVNGNVTVPNGVKTISYAAFNLLDGLTSVTIPSGVTTIENYAFNGCESLTSVTIPDSVTSLGQGVFAECKNLARVLLPKRFEGSLDSSVFFSGCPAGLSVSYYDALYAVRFHRNDASDEKTADYDFAHGVDTHLPSLKSLGWARRGCDFLGWATSRANADAGKVWKKDWAAVSSPVAAGKTLDVYAVWALKSGSYAIEFVRNDGAGTWRTVGFNYGEKTRMPSLANGLGWARRGYDFKGWALTTADANAGKVWKGDWAYVATPVKAGEVLTAYAVWELKPGFYQIRFNKNDGSGKWRTLGFECDKSTKLSTIAGLGWERPGYTFRGWASNAANAAAGKVWKADGAWIRNVAAEGKTLSIYAIWE